MDSQLAIETAFDVLNTDWEVDRILWRGGQDEIFSQHVVLNKQNRLGWQFRQWFNPMIADLNSDAISAAHQRNMEIWMVQGLYEFGGPADSAGAPFGFQFRITRQHPEWMPVNRYGTRRQAGPIAFCYPEARHWYINLLVDDLVEKGYDGISFYTYCENFTIRYEDEFGYNQPVVDEYKKRYGVDILTEDFDINLWADLRGEYTTAFLNELRTSLNAHSIKLAVWLSPTDPDKPQIWGVHFPHTITAGNITIDWRSWVDDGAVDELYFYGYDETNVQIVKNYCQATIVEVTAQNMYGDLPSGVNRSFQIYEFQEAETGCSYANRLGTVNENLPTEQLSSLYGNDVKAKRRVLYLIEREIVSATVNDIISVVNDSDVYVRRAAIRALASTGNSSAVPYIEAALNDVENSVCVQAVESLGVLRGNNSLVRIFDVVRNGGSFQFNYVAVPQMLRTIKENGQSDAYIIASLILALTDTDMNVRRTALRAIKNATPAGWNSLRPYLTDILQNDSDAFCREMAVALCGYFNTDSQVMMALQNAFYDEDHVVQTRAAYYQDFKSLESRFAMYGDYCTRTDADWGWREIGDKIIAKYPMQAVDSLKSFVFQKDDTLLAERAWRSLYLPQSQSGYKPSNQMIDKKNNFYFPRFKNKLAEKVFYDDFENVDPQLSALPVASKGIWDFQNFSVNEVFVAQSILPAAAYGGKFLIAQISGPNKLIARFAMVPSNYRYMNASFYFQVPEDKNNNFTVSLTSVVLQSIIDIKFAADGYIYYRSAGDFVSTGIKYQKSQWQRVIIMVDDVLNEIILHSAGISFGGIIYDAEISAINSLELYGGDVYIDKMNISVIPDCSQWPVMDFTGDCKVDLQDFAEMALAMTENAN